MDGPDADVGSDQQRLRRSPRATQASASRPAHRSATQPGRPQSRGRVNARLARPEREGKRDEGGAERGQSGERLESPMPCDAERHERERGEKEGRDVRPEEMKACLGFPETGDPMKSAVSP